MSTNPIEDTLEIVTDLRFQDGSSNYISIPAPSSALGSNITFPLPTTNGTTNQILTKTASGSAWANNTGGTADSLSVKYGASEGMSSSTSQTIFTQKLRVTFTTEAADYYIGWSAEVRSVDSGASIVSRIQIDDSVSVMETEWNPDTEEEVSYGSLTGFVITALTAASHNFDLDFRSSKVSETVNMRRARMVIFKVNQL